MCTSFYRSFITARKAVLLASVLAAGCAARPQRIDDQRLTGVPAERLDGVKASLAELALAKSAREKTRDALREAEQRLRLATAERRLAEDAADVLREKFELAKLSGENEGVVAAGGALRAGAKEVRKAEAGVEAAKRALELQDAQLAELEARVKWLEWKHEYERAKVVLRYEAQTPGEKLNSLSEYENVMLEAELAWKKAESAVEPCRAALQSALDRRQAIDLEP